MYAKNRRPRVERAGIQPSRGQVSPRHRQHSPNPPTKPAIRLQHQTTQSTTNQRDGQGGDGEASQVGRQRGALGHFRTMGEAMKQHERANQSATHSRRQFGQGGDEDTGDQHGEGNPCFNARQAQAAPGQGGAEYHAADDEGGGGVFHEFALAHAPEADGGHGQQVVQAQHGVQQAAGEAAFGVTGVGHGGGGSGQQRGGGEKF